MKGFRSYGHVLLLFSFPVTLAYHTSTIQQKIPKNGGQAGTSRLATRISTDPVISRSFFLSTVTMAMFVAPIVATAMPSDEPASFSSKEGSDTQRLDVAQQQIPLQKKNVAGPSSLQESMSGFIAGGALAATKTLVKYPLDTATVRLQVPGSGYSVSELGKLFSGSYDGVTASLLSNIPAGAVFFAVKDAAKASLKNSAMNAAPAWATTTLAVGAALIPYWIIRNPSEVIKVRQQTGVPGYGDGVSVWDAVQLTFNETAAAGGSTLDGIGGFYTGYWENIIYGLPADVIKFVAYESITGGRKDLSPVEGARAGAVATAAAQLLTTPLDVVRNRLMTGSKFESKNDSGETPRSNYIERLMKLGKEEGLGGLFAGGTPRVAKAFLSGAIQFATYEETKQSIARLLQNR